MSTVAIIGGIGCGKSSVTQRLATHGAAVVDADVIAREVVEPGSPVLARLVAAFGATVLATDGTLDRTALATLAFADPASTARMNEILHPAIGAELVRQVGEARARAQVVVVAIPLFRPEHRDLLRIDRVVCVECPRDVALERLVAQRGLAREDAELRMAAQVPRDDRVALADEVLDNAGDLEQLSKAVDELWDRLVAA
ncbi:MAG TPA: dephospho-CoA kinase [Acidimicrobiales bacterium]|nr:dephospho-CoA kinase [Acidimicrobiales bacterium]